MREINKFISGTTVFACRFSVPEVGEFTNPAYCGKYALTWDVYATQFDRIRTVCYGIYRPLSLEGDKVHVSGVAMLHSKYPEEFGVKAGILKSFARMVNSIMSPPIWKNSSLAYRRYRKNIWKYFMPVFQKYFETTRVHPFGLWKVAWNKDAVFDNDRIKYLFMDNFMPATYAPPSYANGFDGEWNYFHNQVDD